MDIGITIDHRAGTAAELHAAWPVVETDPGRRAMALCQVAAPAVVLGSTQRADDVVDAARARHAGLEVAKRRSGGGAVLVGPADPVWIDVWVPRDDPRWHDDVARAFDRVGDLWRDALERLEVGGLSVHRQGTAACTRWSKLVCFGGIGTGEVLAGDGRKLVGLSQRRSRWGAWFHGACYEVWDPRPLVDVLALPDDERAAAASELQSVAVGLQELMGSTDASVPPPGRREVSDAGVADVAVPGLSPRAALQAVMVELLSSW